MATDNFIRIGDIKGESLDDRHRDEIDVLSWAWGVTQSGTIAAGGGGGTGKASFSDLSFVHHIDKATPVLMQACATGEHVKEATLTVRKAGKGQQEFLIVKMSDVIITAVQPSVSGGDGGMLEQISLSCAQVDLAYSPQKADGSLDASIHFKFDMRANKVL